MIPFLLWLILLVVAWPLALLALVLYPIVWLLSIPLRLVGISVGAIFDLIKAVLRLPARVREVRAATATTHSLSRSTATGAVIRVR